MATTRIIPMHINKSQTIAQMLTDSTGYGLNPEKTGRVQFITAYACDRHTSRTLNSYLRSASMRSLPDGRRTAA